MTVSTGGPTHSSHEEEEEAPTATSVKTVSCVNLNKHKSKVKQNKTLSFLIKRNDVVLFMLKAISSLEGTVPFLMYL